MGKRSPRRYSYDESQAALWHRQNMGGKAFREIAAHTGISLGKINHAVQRYREVNSLKGPGHRGPKTPRSTNAPFHETVPSFRTSIPLLSFEEALSKDACRFIDGDPKDNAVYCGYDRTPGSVYCAGHHAICWRPAPEIRFARWTK